MNTPQRKLKVAIVGLGHLHPRSYMPHFTSLPAVETIAVCETDTALREAFCRDFNVRGYSTLDEMLSKECPDIAAIFLPHADCPAAAAKCASRKIHLMVEKPMAASADGASQIVEAARQAGVKLTTGYAWRLHPVAREFKKIVDDGLIGRVVGAEGRCAAGRLNRYIEGHSPWMLQRARSGGGPMYNLGVHWIDLFRWILGDEVAEVSGRNVKVNTEYDIEDNSFAHLKFSRGTVAALDISYTVPDAFPYGRDLYLSVRGTQGVISWAPAFEGQKDELFICSDHPGFGGIPRVTRSYELQPTPGYCGHMGREYIKSFVEAVLQGTQPPVSGEDGLAALRIVEAIYRSDSEKRWITL
ncbi:MAG: Gfo/Idh/MocA family oxidoreductase [Verrucomicrobiae bacterium]|nr:Gfo/Idh/MocA family oxidoreductase [Verrucomicrobiae bacterium]